MQDDADRVRRIVHESTLAAHRDPSRSQVDRLASFRQTHGVECRDMPARRNRVLTVAPLNAKRAGEFGGPNGAGAEPPLARSRSA